MDEWMDRLREQTGDVRPANEAHDRITQELGRRRRRRRRLTGAGAVVSVAAVVGAIGFVPRVLDRDAADPTEAATSAPSTVATAPTDPGPSSLLPVFTCPLDNPVFTDDPPELDLQTINDQKRTYSEIVNRDFDGFEIQEIETFVYYGVYVLVTGDLARAKQVLKEYGVSGVALWDSGPGLGLDPYAQFDRMLQADLDAEMRYAKITTRGIAGRAGFAYWEEAGAILVQWELPVPEEVQALEDADVAGDSRIIVRGVPYSAAEVRDAQKALIDWLDLTGERDDLLLPDYFSSSSACGDFTGLVVGVAPDFLTDSDIGELQREIAEVIGMPARVVPEEMPIMR